MVLTCKSFVILGYRGEKLIEPSSSWFLPKFPSGKMELWNFHQVKRMIGGIGEIVSSTYSQTLNGREPGVTSLNSGAESWF